MSDASTVSTGSGGGESMGSGGDATGGEEGWSCSCRI